MKCQPFNFIWSHLPLGGLTQASRKLFATRSTLVLRQTFQVFISHFTLEMTGKHDFLRRSFSHQTLCHFTTAGHSV